MSYGFCSLSSHVLTCPALSSDFNSDWHLEGNQPLRHSTFQELYNQNVMDQRHSRRPLPYSQAQGMTSGLGAISCKREGAPNPSARKPLPTGCSHVQIFT
jgi:hypothetical protein